MKFFLCQPATVTTNGGNCSAGGDQIGTPAEGETLVNGSATSESTTNTTAIGKYCWRAEYVPAIGSPYSAKSHTNSTTECFTTVAQPTSMTTRQFVVPQDKVVITAPAGSGNLAGNVRFTLHDSLWGQARSDIKYDSQNIPISGASPQPATTANTHRIVDGTTHYWNVSYASTNLGQLGSSSVCSETTSVTFLGNDGGISIP